MHELSEARLLIPLRRTVHSQCRSSYSQSDVCLLRPLQRKMQNQCASKHEFNADHCTVSLAWSIAKDKVQALVP